MALPIQIRNCLDNLWDFLIDKNDNTMACERVQVAGRTYKIKLTKTKDENENSKYFVEITRRD